MKVFQECSECGYCPREWRDLSTNDLPDIDDHCHNCGGEIQVIRVNSDTWRVAHIHLRRVLRNLEQFDDNVTNTAMSAVGMPANHLIDEILRNLRFFNNRLPHMQPRL